MVRIELVSSRPLLFHRYSHFFELLQDKVYALINRHTVPKQAMYGFGHRIVLIITNTVCVEFRLFFSFFIKDTRRNSRRRGWICRT